MQEDQQTTTTTQPPQQKAEKKQDKRRKTTTTSGAAADGEEAGYSKEWIAFINTKSGGQQGATMLKKIAGLLPEDQIFDLMKDKGPSRGLQRWLQTPHYRIFVAGGDGTVGWVLGAIDNLNVPPSTPAPHVGVCPLGTGNDLARVYGWGGGYSGGSVKEILVKMETARTLTLDRWNVTCTPTKKFNPEKDVPPPEEEKKEEEAGEEDVVSDHSEKEEEEEKEEKHEPKKKKKNKDKDEKENNKDKGKDKQKQEDKEEKDHKQAKKDTKKKQHEDKKHDDKKKKNENGHHDDKHENEHDATESELPPAQSFIMNNYFSIGTDAEIALSFHNMRNKHTGLFQMHLVNKGWYAGFGAKAMFAGGHGPLKQYLKLEVDGKEVNLPNRVRGVVVINLPSYMGGTNPWGTSADPKYQEPAIDDGLLEVIGIKGAMHLGRIQTRTSRGIRLAQGRSLRLTTSKALPAQVDGEPWLMIPSQTDIHHLSTSQLLYNMTQRRAERNIAKLSRSVVTTTTTTTKTTKQGKEGEEELTVVTTAVVTKQEEEEKEAAEEGEDDGGREDDGEVAVVVENEEKREEGTKKKEDGEKKKHKKEEKGEAGAEEEGEGEVKKKKKHKKKGKAE
ncbi:Diacylglycerol kinase [Balamuthia mandrillaris]